MVSWWRKKNGREDDMQNQTLRKCVQERKAFYLQPIMPRRRFASVRSAGVGQFRLGNDLHRGSVGRWASKAQRKRFVRKKINEMFVCSIGRAN